MTQVSMPEIFVGGLNGFASLANPSATRQFRATGRGGFYLHYSALDPKFAQGSVPQMAAVLGNPAGSMAEIGLFHPGFFQQEWRVGIRSAGFNPTIAVVNLPWGGPVPVSPETVAMFSTFVIEGHAAGLAILAPVIVPNDAPDLRHPFAERYWDNARQAALDGGGLALDTPPGFYLNGFPTPEQVSAYHVFVADALSWGLKRGLHCTVIISPYYDRGVFLENAKKLYHALEKDRLLPNAWVVETYDDGVGPSAALPNGAASFGIPVGSDDQPETVAGVAFWFARHAKTSPYVQR